MKCDNYEEDKEQCRYFEALHGVHGEELPTGCDEISGRCKPFDENNDWYDVEVEDCDFVDFE